MKLLKSILTLRTSLVIGAALTLVASPAFALVDLVAIQGQWTPQGGSPITMWGFALDTGQACNSLPAWTPGPEIRGDDLQNNGNLRIRLRNCLNEPVSIIIPGQKAIVPGNGSQTPQPVKNGNRIVSFTAETPAVTPTTPNGVTFDYLWRRVNQNEGTYLYTSGSHPAKQVHMGLYGALKIGQYANTSADVTLLYSEVDASLHNPPTAATPLGYKPDYYLVNGAETAMVTAGDTVEPTVISFLNAGLDFHVPALNGGYMTLQAEDGNPYPFGKEQYSVNLAAGKTIEAFWQPTAEGEYKIFDRRGNNMVATLVVGTAGDPPPVANNDAFAGTEDTLLSVITPDGVRGNDGDPTLEVELVGGPSAGTLSCPSAGTVLLCPDGSFDYQPNGNFFGDDTFTYKSIAITGTPGTPSSNTATVTLSIAGVNDNPTAGDDSYEVVPGIELAVAPPGLLANDQDIDGDDLSVNNSDIPGTVNGDGSFAVTIATDSAATYFYEVCDNGAPQLCATANVTITAANDTPVANDDAATVKRNSSPGTTDNGDPAGSDRNIFSLVDNDTDAQGINPATLVLSDTSRGGTVVANPEGTVSYTPPKRFRGTDTFTYTVSDTLGAPSNEATVRVNVVRTRDLPPITP